MTNHPQRATLDYQVGDETTVRRTRWRLDTVDVVLTVLVCAVLGMCAAGLVLSSIL